MCLQRTKPTHPRTPKPVSNRWLHNQLDYRSLFGFVFWKFSFSKTSKSLNEQWARSLMHFRIIITLLYCVHDNQPQMPSREFIIRICHAVQMFQRLQFGDNKSFWSFCLLFTFGFYLLAVYIFHLFVMKLLTFSLLTVSIRDDKIPKICDMKMAEIFDSCVQLGFESAPVNKSAQFLVQKRTIAWHWQARRVILKRELSWTGEKLSNFNFLLFLCNLLKEVNKLMVPQQKLL